MAADRQQEFLFLTQSFVSGKRSQREKELQDADRRAHAARNSRSKRPVHSADNIISSANRRPKKPPVHQTSESKQAVLFPESTESLKQRHLDIRPRTPTNEEGSPIFTHNSDCFSSLTSLGQGNHDPFDTASVAGLPPFIDGVLDHCFRPVWPTLGCADPHAEEKLTLTRRRGIREHPFMLHAYITNAVSHSLHLHQPGHAARTLLGQARQYHERKTFEGVSSALKSQRGEVSDGVLMALFIVVFTPGDYDDHVTTYPASPLATAQSLHLYTNMEVTPGRIQHIQRISRLLDTRGGLDGVSQHDWVNASIMADVFVASRLGVRPLWQWPTSLQHHFEAFHDLVLDPPAHQLSLVMGQGFSCLDHVGLRHILALACRTTLAVDLYHRRAASAPKLWELTKVRNAIQHALCSLDPPTGLLPTHEDLLYDIVRLATLIYSDLVLFPLGECVLLRLAYDLRKALELLSTGDGLQSRTQKELVLWCIAMGAMGSYGNVHQEWYVEQFSRAVREDERLSDWSLFQTLMSHYLWWKHVLQPRCLDVWSESVQLLRPEASSSITPRTEDNLACG